MKNIIFIRIHKVLKTRVKRGHYFLCKIGRFATLGILEVFSKYWV